MKLSFAETMRGRLRTADGAEHPVSFSVRTRGEGGGRFGLGGTIEAAPWAAGAPVEGSLHIGPWLRFIRYEVRFPADGGLWALRGEKTPTPWAPLRSMTTLPMVLTDARGAEVARGTLRFALRDLPGFVASWLR